MQSTALRITALGHAGIAVRDLQASKAFYSGVLGMHALPLDTSPSAAGTGAQGLPGAGAQEGPPVEARNLSFQVSESEQLIIREVAHAPDRHLNGVHHIAFIVGNTPSMLDAAAEHLDAHQVSYERVAHEEHESLYCRDPDGHIVELYYWPSW